MFAKLIDKIDSALSKIKLLGVLYAAALYGASICFIMSIGEVLHVNSFIINFICLVFWLAVGGMFVLSKFTFTGLRHLLGINIILGGLVFFFNTSFLINVVINFDLILLAFIVLVVAASLTAIVLHFYITLYTKRKDEQAANVLRYHKLITDPFFFSQHVNPTDQLFELYDKLKESGRVSTAALEVIAEYNIKERKKFNDYVCHGIGNSVKGLVEYKHDIGVILAADSKTPPHIFVTAMSKFELFFPE